MDRPKRNHLTVCASAGGAARVKIQLFAPAVLKFCLFSVAEDI
jgi:hypothetical protein